MTTIERTMEQTIAAIQTLDLDPIKFKLMNKKEGHGWSRDEADRYELEYKRFLTLLVKYSSEMMAPNINVDKFWHGHILDTMKYAEDCNQVFGYFVHHFPYFGMRGKEDASNLAAAAANMKRLYEQEFGLEQGGDASYCGATNASYCGATNASYCGATNASAKVSQGSASLANHLLNIHSRPTLPRVVKH